MNANWFEKKTKYLRDKNLHVIGIAGTEAAATLEFLVEKVECKHVTAHEQSERGNFMKSFRGAHFARPWAEMKPMGEKITSYDEVTYHFGSEYLVGVDDAELIFVPQSWYLYAQNDQLKTLTKKLSSFMRLYFDLFPGKIIGVTGSNGKTTTSNMIYGILERAHSVDGGFKGQVYFAGNDRRNEQVLNRVDSMDEEDWLVLEISNRHLKVDLGKSPNISVITNITPNHLPEYKDFYEYRKCKESLLQHMTRDDVAVLNRDDDESRLTIEHLDHEIFEFSVEEQLSHGAYLAGSKLLLKHAEGEEVVMEIEDLNVRGKHNSSNALAAAAACHLAGVSPDIIAEGLRDFEGVPRRLEFVRTISVIPTVESEARANEVPARSAGGEGSPEQKRENSGLGGSVGLGDPSSSLGMTNSIIPQNDRKIEYYNDLASTTPESTLAAIEALSTPLSDKSRTSPLVRGESIYSGVILICGGESKGSDYAELASRLKEKVKRVVFLDSPLADEMKELLGDDFVSLATDTATTMKEAVELASGHAEAGDKVVLSPAGDYGWFRGKMQDRKKFRSFVGKP